jgi:hypothetical protein
VQVTRVIPIPKATAEANARMQMLVRGITGRAGKALSFSILRTNRGAVAGASQRSRIFFRRRQRAREHHAQDTWRRSAGLCGQHHDRDLLPAWGAGGWTAGHDYRVAPGSPPADPTLVFGTESFIGRSAGLCVGFKLDSQGKKVPIYGINANGGRNGKRELQLAFANRSSLTRAAIRHPGYQNRKPPRPQSQALTIEVSR